MKGLQPPRLTLISVNFHIDHFLIYPLIDRNRNDSPPLVHDRHLDHNLIDHLPHHNGLLSLYDLLVILTSISDRDQNHLHVKIHY